jgi:hypothetical protein
MLDRRPSAPLRRRTLNRPLLALVLLGLVGGLAACGDDPFLYRWVENPREALLFSLDRDERNRPSAFAMLEGQRVILEGTTAQGLWDFALDRRNGQLHLVPPRALGVQSRAGVFVVPNARYEEVREAPSDTASYVTREPVLVEAGNIYVIRTRQQTGMFGEACVHYGKVQPLEVDHQAGTLLFRFDTSPDCNNPSLVPPS